MSILLPQSYTAAATDAAATAYISANGSAASVGGYWSEAAAQTTINVQQYGNTAYGAGTVAVAFVAVFEVQ